MQWLLGDELVVDNFAGGGGASTGIEWALQRPVNVAVNHDPDAIAMHRANHPATTHYCENVFNIDPLKVTGGRPVGLAWFSPDCTHHSKARGGKPKKKSIRGLAWVVVRWARVVRPRVIMLENVEEFEDWGPLDRNGMPCPERRGSTFRFWLGQLERQGYHRIEWRLIRACDHGAPTTRQRLVLVARRDGAPVCWPEPSHGPGLQPYRCAADVIDFSLDCPSIFDRPRPLVEATMERVAKGVWRYVINTDSPFIAPPEAARAAGLGNRHAAVAMFMAQHNTGMVGHPMTAPVSTIVTKGCTQGLVAAHVINLKGSDRRMSPADAPVPTLCAAGTHVGEVRAFLTKYYGTGGQWQGCDEPMHTLTAKARMGLVMVAGEPWQIADVGMRMLQPREGFNAQGFPASYIIDRGAGGRRLSKADQWQKCGNSVSPYMAAAMVAANMNGAEWLPAQARGAA